MFAMYSIATGLISSTVNKMPVNEQQLAGLAAAGYAFVEVPDHVNGSNAVIDVETKLPIVFEEAPPPVPNILVQMAAAMIHSGQLSVDAFHPVTVAEMNGQLTSSRMVAVPASKGVGSKVD